jgi:C_GCAxxG_C_C family probable redox protein
MTLNDEATTPEAAGMEALQLFGENRLYCAEAVLTVLSRRQGIQSRLVPAIATGFCSGVSRTAGTCGAVSGAVMALGLAYGRKNGTEPVERSYAAVNSFLEAFEREFGSCNCAGLLGCHLGTDEGQRSFVEQKLIARCRTFTQRATEIAAVLLDRYPCGEAC